MQLFLSWSGAYSKAHAEAFAVWLPCVLQNVECYLSSHSIDAGERWSDSIGGALKDTDFGLLFVTKQNKSSEWLMYEAGALAKNVTKSRVIPIMINLETIDIQRSPLIHFQAVKPDFDGISRILDSVHNCIEDPDLDKNNLRRCLEKWYPDLQKSFDEVDKPKEETSDDVDENDLPVEESLSTILSMISGLQRDIRQVRNVSQHGSLELPSINDHATIRYNNPDYWEFVLQRIENLEDWERQRSVFRERCVLPYERSKQIDMKFIRKRRALRMGGENIRDK